MAGEGLRGVENLTKPPCLIRLGRIAIFPGTGDIGSSLMDVPDSVDVELVRDLSDNAISRAVVRDFPCAHSKWRTLCITCDRMTWRCCWLLILRRMRAVTSSAWFTKTKVIVPGDALEGVWLESSGESGSFRVSVLVWREYLNNQAMHYLLL